MSLISQTITGRQRVAYRWLYVWSFRRSSHSNRQKLPSSTTPLSFEAPARMNPMRVSACTLYFRKLESLAYIFVAYSVGLPLFKFVHCSPKDTSFLQQSAFWPFKVIQSKGRTDFLLARHCDYGPILHRFWDTVTYWLKLPIFATPLSFGALAPYDAFVISRSLLPSMPLRSVPDKP